MAQKAFDRRVAAVRRFNRFYTRQIGLLEEGYLKSPFSLTEVRVLYELAHRDRTTAGELGRDLGLDAGYLSRILAGFQKRGLLKRSRSARDGRQTDLALTARGRAAMAPLEARSHRDIGRILAAAPEPAQRRLVDAMRANEGILGPGSEAPAPCLVRPHRPGDMGWVIHRHAALYAQEYGLDVTFEALVARIAARFIERYDPKRERAFIAEVNGAIVGSALLIAHSKTVAQLRLMLVEPEARGLGLGTRLVDECIRFAREAGYRKVTLWTNSILLAARHVYEKAGFRLARAERYRGFGRTLVGETWDLAL